MLNSNYKKLINCFISYCRKNFIIKVVVSVLISSIIIYLIAGRNFMRVDRIRTSITVSFVEDILGNTDRSNDYLIKKNLSERIKYVEIKPEEISIETVGYKKIINIDNAVLLKLDFNTLEEYKDQIRVICKLAVSNSLRINENPSTLLLMNLNCYLSEVKSELVVYGVVYNEVTNEVTIHGSYEDCTVNLN